MEQKDYRLAAIMYTDIVGFSRMMEKDEAGTLGILRLHNTIVTEIATKRHGTVIKTIGDAFLVDFRNTVEALQCAMEIQDAIYSYNKEGKGQPLLMRIGLHLGDIYFFENDALGEGINIASRLQSFARPGSICFSQDVYNQVLNKIDFRADKLGKVSLKNITKEIHAYEILSPNVEFDPDRDKPRPGFTPVHLEAVDPALPGVPPAETVSVPKASPATRALPGGTASPAERGYDPEAAKTVLSDIRKAILADTKNMGRRLTVDEALERYGEYGVEAHEVIASMADNGLIQKRMPQSTQQAAGTTASSDLAADIGRAVEGIARAIEHSVGDWQKSSGSSRGNRHESRPGSNYGQNMENRAESVAEKIEHAVGRIDHAFNEKHALKIELKRHEAEVGTGKWDAELRGSEHFKPGSEELETDFTRYRDKVEAKAHKTSSGFVGNAISFAGVNALLWYINLVVAPGFMWAPIVTAAWGTGIISNLFAMIRGKAKVAEMNKVPELQPEALDIYKKIHRVKDGLASHLATILTVPPLLFTINLLTSPGFLWAAIPSGIMALSFIGHLITYPGTLRGLERKLWRVLGIDSWRELFTMGKGQKAGAGAGPYASVYTEVASIRDQIVRDIKAGKGSDEFGKDMIPTLNRYVEQVKMLSHSVNEIDGIVASIPVAELKRDREALEVKRSQAGNQALKDEYSRSIAEIARQEKASTDLEDQRELLRLRLGSSANALKQLKIDMARMKALPEAGERQAMEDLRNKARELAGYLDDLKTGYDESLADPYAELERLAAEAETRAKITDGRDDGSAQGGAPSGTQSGETAGR